MMADRQAHVLQFKRAANQAARSFYTQRAFTLVELLVVIGIIAVLIGILLPSLNRARARSSQTACMSNLRQIGLAVRMYANDNRDHYPGPDVTGNFAFRRRPGLRDPRDSNGLPEWLGLSAALHGIAPNE